MSDLIIYKCSKGIISHFDVRRLIVKRMILAENKVGMHYTPSFENPNLPYNKIVYKKLLIIAIARPDCLDCYI